MPQPVYLNIAIRGDDTRAIPASKDVTRSGVIVHSGDEYYVSVARLSFKLNVPIIIVPVKFPEFTFDGVSTQWNLTVRHTDALGVRTEATTYLQLLLDNPTFGATEQPEDLDVVGVWTLVDWQRMLNHAVEQAYNDVNATLGMLLPSTPPFFSLNSDGTMAVTFDTFALWEETQRAPGAEYLELFSNMPVSVLNGWSAKLDQERNEYRFNVVSNGYNYSPANMAGTESLKPLDPTKSTIKIAQDFPTQQFPSIERVSLLSSLSIVPEYTPSLDGKSSSKILTDFAPDMSLATKGATLTSYVYNSTYGDARWIKLLGAAPVTSLNVSLTTIDWMGKERPFMLYGSSESVGVKLAFAPRRMVEGYPH